MSRNIGTQPLSYIKISQERMLRAIEENDQILRSFFSKNSPRPIRRIVKGLNVGQEYHIFLDGKRYDLRATIANNIFHIK